MISADVFILQFDEFSSWSPTKQVDYLTYYSTKYGGKESVSSADITGLLHILHLKEYKRIRSYFSENVSNRKGKYVKVGNGYHLTMGRHNEIDKEISQEPQKITVSDQLTNLIVCVSDDDEKGFLIEAIDCYRVGSNRAFIVMVWLVIVSHLQKYIFTKWLHNFNIALAKNPDKKISCIHLYDDFSDLPEGKLIELARSAKLISNDVRKLLDEKLGIRNSAAHPSNIKFSSHKATEFAIDLIDNVLLKYQ